MTSTPELTIDIVSDVVCPWCIVGYRQLQQALDQSGRTATLRWHPFELNPQMPQEGQNLREHLMQKYGISKEESVNARERLTQLGRELKFDFNFHDEMRILNTFQAHKLIHWASEQGKGHALKQALFAAYFTDGRDVSQTETLLDIAKEAGLDRDKAETALKDEALSIQVQSEEEYWRNNGITGVPAVIFNQRHLVVGAQGTENYLQILDQLAPMEA